LNSARQTSTVTPTLAPEVSALFYTLRDRVLGSLDGEARMHTCLLVTSCHGGEGVSTIALNFAIALGDAQKGRVLLCDANVDAPVIHKLFDLNHGNGLTDAVAGLCTAPAAICGTGLPALDVLPAGAHQMVLSQVVESERLPGILEELREQYAFIVIDAPPVLECGATAPLAAIADGTILVVEAERERWEVAQRATSLLHSANARILGAVLNKRQFHIPNWLYRRLL
jgi:capsular exopolysaccharide synthesis family protein